MDGHQRFQAVTAPTSQSPRSASLAPYRVLSVILFASSVTAILFAAFPVAGEWLRNADIAAAIGLAGLGVIALVIAPRIPDGWGLDGLLTIVIVVGGVGLTQVPSGESQVVIGLGLSFFAVFAAYFRPRSRYLGLLALSLVAFAVGATVNPLLSSPVVAVAILAAIAGMSFMVYLQASRMRELVLHDPLTGILNRRGLEFHAPQLASAAARSGTTVTVGLVDLDDFKGFNDAYGHAAGDDLLVAVAEDWRGQLRASDLVVRYGGDEFAMVMVGIGVADAEQLANRVAASRPGLWSAGFSEWSADEDVYEALARADAAMFRAKPKK